MEPYDIDVILPDGRRHSIPAELAPRFTYDGKLWTVEIRNCRYWAVPYLSDAAPPPLPWIATADRLPEAVKDGDRILLWDASISFMPRPMVAEADGNGDDAEWYPHGTSRDFAPLRLRSFTHWLRLTPPR